MPAPDLDFVLVVSDAASMAAYRDVLIENLHRFALVLSSLQGGLPSVQVAVVGDDTGDFQTEATIVGCALPAGPFIVDLDTPWFRCVDDPDACRQRNYTGDLGEAMACIGAVVADSSDSPPLLDRLDRALARDDGFPRPGAYLHIIVIGVDDDGSPDDVETYAARLLEGRDRFTTSVSAITGGSSPRFEELVSRFENAGDVISIDGADWSDAVPFGGAIIDPMFTCLREGVARADLDPAAPGLQLDCVAEDRGAVVPPCTMTADDLPAIDTTLPCYWFRPASFDCDFRAIIEREHHELVPPLPELRCTCAP